MRIGYARVSIQDQDNTAQIAALIAAGCGRIFEEKVSAGRWVGIPVYRDRLFRYRDRSFRLSVTGHSGLT